MSGNIVMSLSPEKLIEYKRGAAARWRVDRKLLRDRYGRARKLADKAASCLKREYGVTRVLLFGSLLDESRFTHRSDIDLAVRGINPCEYFTAVAKLLALDKDIEINLVDFECCRPSLRTAIEKEGTEL